MSLWLIKRLPHGGKRLCYVGTKAVYGCPAIDGIVPNFEDKHSRDRRVGERLVVTVSDQSELLADEDSVTTMQRIVVTKTGKVNDKFLPVCKCGETFVKRGYRFWLKDEDHSPKAIIIDGFARNACHDKTLEDKFFKTRKAANKHRDVIYGRVKV